MIDNLRGMDWPALRAAIKGIIKEKIVLPDVAGVLPPPPSTSPHAHPSLFVACSLIHPPSSESMQGNFLCNIASPGLYCLYASQHLLVQVERSESPL